MRRERGASSVLALMLASGLVALIVVLAGLVVVVDVRHRARTAADLAAVAAAETWVRGGAPCSVAATLAEANGGWLRRCVVDADAVGVAVEVRRNVATGVWSASALEESWAGPVSELSPALVEPAPVERGQVRAGR